MVPYNIRLNEYSVTFNKRYLILIRTTNISGRAVSIVLVATDPVIVVDRVRFAIIRAISVLHAGE